MIKSLISVSQNSKNNRSKCCKVSNVILSICDLLQWSVIKKHLHLQLELLPWSPWPGLIYQLLFVDEYEYRVIVN